MVAISIPIFTAQLEKAREATDAANLRSAYAVCSSDALMNSDVASYKGASKAVTITQTEKGFSKLDDSTKIGTIVLKDDAVLKAAEANSTVYVNVSVAGALTITTTAVADFSVISN